MEFMSIEVNTNKQILSSEIRIFKTERFFSQTKKLVGIDKLILKISESIELNFEKILRMTKHINSKTIRVETLDKMFAFIVNIVETKIDDKHFFDIVFDEFFSGFGKIKTNDVRCGVFLKSNKIFKCQLYFDASIVSNIDTNKLYYISNSEYVNFPMLSDKQQELVNIENQNVLVQGVAGSGKTNICIAKIIFVACKGYSGRILYSTFSRGLLIDTKTKIEKYKNSLKDFVDDYKNGKIIFLDKNRKLAIENRLGLFLIADNEKNIIKKLENIISFLENNVDYFLIADIYRHVFDEDVKFSDEKVFINDFLINMKNHQLKNRFEKLKNISYSVCYKEIYGMIFGTYRKENQEMLSFDEYKKLRENSFEKSELEVIYDLAKEYEKFQKVQNLLDNNKISNKLLKNIEKIPKYSLSIIDEVQDFTEINLQLINQISLKMFAVGDALQMINPTYFSFAGLKRIMFKEDVTTVADLECNYRNNKKIVEILDELGKINIRAFGTHSFVLSGESMDSGTMTNSIYVNDIQFFNKLRNDKFENFTILVASNEDKKKYQKIFSRQEVLTISEIKGLERDTILLMNVLSSNEENWKKLERNIVNHKEADENSVYRYYYNLFYVGISRAKHNIFVFEEKKINMFNDFFKDNFECLNYLDAYKKFTEIIEKIEINDDEIWDRINEFIKVGQFDNARTYVSRFEDSIYSFQANEKIDAYQNYVFNGKNRDAGIKLWKAGLNVEAKEQFEISGDKQLIDFLENLEGQNDSKLNIDIVKYFCDFEENKEAQKLILEIVEQDLNDLRTKHKEIKSMMKKFKEK